MKDRSQESEVSEGWQEKKREIKLTFTEHVLKILVSHLKSTTLYGRYFSNNTFHEL